MENIYDIIGLLLGWVLVGLIAAMLFGATVRMGEAKSRRALRQRVRHDLTAFPLTNRR